MGFPTAPQLDAADVTVFYSRNQGWDLRAAALLDGRSYATPDDVKRVALPALRHRVALAPDAIAHGDRDRALGVGLADDEAVELGNDLARGKFVHTHDSTVSTTTLLLV